MLAIFSTRKKQVMPNVKFLPFLYAARQRQPQCGRDRATRAPPHGGAAWEIPRHRKRNLPWWTRYYLESFEPVWERARRVSFWNSQTCPTAPTTCSVSFLNVPTHSWISVTCANLVRLVYSNSVVLPFATYFESYSNRTYAWYARSVKVWILSSAWIGRGESFEWARRGVVRGAESWIP